VKDSDIISQAALGNKGAYRELLRKYANLALAVAFARSGNRETARLGAADAFVQASKELSNLPEVAPISPWIASVTRAEVAKRMSGTRRASLTLEAAKERIEKALEEAGGPGQLDPDVKSELAMVALNALSDQEREALCLRHIYSTSYTDIASAMTIEASQADDQIAKARDQLAEILKPLFGLNM
jgi:RNA polymerase sigma-70 factor (ECF subfamily)